MAVLTEDQIGFAAVDLAGGVYTQLPDIVCTEIAIGYLAYDITVADSVSPGNAAVALNNYVSGQGIHTVITIPTGGNANNLFINPGAGSQTMPFMWRNARIPLVGLGA